MKKFLCMLLAVLLLASVGTAAFAEGKRVVYEENGLTLTYTEEFNKENLKGVFYPYPYGQSGNGIYMITFSYYAMTQEELDIALEKDISQYTEAELALFRSKQGLLSQVYAIDSKQISAKDAAILEQEKDYFIEIAKVDDVTFYRVNLDDATEEYLAGIAPAYQEEFRTLQAALLKVLENAEYSVPFVASQNMVGKVISFETSDLDGNPVKSADLFKDHEITMVNLWATWCHNCVDEMTGLGEMAQRLADKNVAVVGICMDADDNLDGCREILKEHNVDYLNLMPVYNLDELLEWEGSLPTSYFFDSEGRLMCTRFRGAPQTMDAYEEVIDSLLSGDTVKMQGDAPNTAPNGEGVFRVIVSDSDGDLVKGVTIQFCSDTTCTMGKTDENGVAVFKMEEGQIYTVHVLKVPEGYKKNPDEYKTADTYCDVYISLTKTA